MNLIKTKKGKRKPGTFTLVPNKAKKELSDSAFILYFNIQSNSDTFYDSAHSIKKSTGWGDEKYEKAAKELEVKGYLKRSKHKNKSTGKWEWTYHFDADGLLNKKPSKPKKKEPVQVEIKYEEPVQDTPEVEMKKKGYNPGDDLPTINQSAGIWLDMKN